jgi:hypothetical protein
MKTGVYNYLLYSQIQDLDFAYLNSNICTLDGLFYVILGRYTDSFFLEKRVYVLFRNELTYLVTSYSD